MRRKLKNQLINGTTRGMTAAIIKMFGFNHNQIHSYTTFQNNYNKFINFLNLISNNTINKLQR